MFGMHNNIPSFFVAGFPVLLSVLREERDDVEMVSFYWLYVWFYNVHFILVLFFCQNFDILNPFVEDRQ